MWVKQFSVWCSGSPLHMFSNRETNHPCYDWNSCACWSKSPEMKEHCSKLCRAWGVVRTRICTWHTPNYVRGGYCESLVGTIFVCANFISCIAMFWSKMFCRCKLPRILYTRVSLNVWIRAFWKVVILWWSFVHSKVVLVFQTTMRCAHADHVHIYT